MCSVLFSKEAEQQRRRAVDQEFQPGEIARVAMEQAVALAHRRADVARAVDDEEAVVVLERPARLGLRSPGRDVEIRHAFQPRHDAAGWRLLLACKILAAFVEFEP